jgi:NAD(P)H-hydrate epimerase
MAALRAGAGLVTVAGDAHALPAIAAHAPELMTEPLRDELVTGKRALAIGPGLGVSSEKAAMIRRLLDGNEIPAVIDADGLNNLAEGSLPRRPRLILTPHPGEMSRLTGGGVVSLGSRLDLARSFAREHGVTLVLKGRNTLTALADGTVWINPTGGPAMATAGSGDILTGLVAGMAAQFPDALDRAVVAAVWLHGRAGDLAAAELGELCVVATDLLKYLPRAMHELRHAV